MDFLFDTHHRGSRLDTQPPRVQGARCRTNGKTGYPLSDAVKPTPLPEQREVVKRLLHMVWAYRAHSVRVLLLQGMILALGMAGIGLMGLGVDFIRHTGHVLGVIPHPAKPPLWPFGFAPPDPWSPLAVLFIIGSLIAGLALARGGLNYLYAVDLATLMHRRFIVDLRARVYDKLQRLSFRFYDANASGAIINRVTGDVRAVGMFMEQVLMQGVVLVVSLLVYFAYMMAIHPTLTLACLAPTPILWFTTKRFSQTVRPAFLENRTLFDDLILKLSENLRGIHVVKGFAREGDEIERFRTRNHKVSDHRDGIFRHVAVFQPMIGGLTQFSLFIMLAYGGYLVIQFERAADVEAAARVGLSVGQLLVFAGLLQQFAAQVGNTANLVQVAQHCLTAAERVFEVLDQPLEIASPPQPVQVGRVRGEVRFESVRFGYSPDEPVLEDISLSIPAGNCLALVGETGSGKSSLCSLVSRFYDPQGGRVLIDGINLRDLDLEELRRNVGLVFQESFLFSHTVAANIAFGYPGATQPQIERAAKIAAIHNFIVDLPQGYDTVLHEGGSDLSGGQRQRLAIARAILPDPAVLIMDDPTAAIDPQTEDEILQAMEGAMRGRTTILVSHRMSTLRRSDLVAVLHEGRITESGTHEDLLRAEGRYRHLAELQSADDHSRRLLGEPERNGR